MNEELLSPGGKLRKFLLRFRLVYYSRQIFGKLLPLLVAGLLLLNFFGHVLVAPWVYRGTAAAFICGIFLLLGLQVFRLPFSDRQCAVKLEQLDSDWEVLRAYLWNSRRTELHPYFATRLVAEIETLFREKSLAGLFDKTDYSRMFGGLVLVACLPFLVPAAPSLPVADQPGGQPLKLRLSRPVVLRGDTVAVSLPAGGYSARPVLQVKYLNEAPRRVSWDRRDSKLAWTSFPLRRTLALRVSLADRQSAWQKVKVVEKPEFTKREVTVTPPEYTGLEQRTVQTREVEFYPGSQLQLSFAANRTFRFWRVKNAAGEILKEVKNTDRLNFYADLRQSRSFRLEAADTYGFRPDTYTLQFRPRPDGAPELELVQPDPEAKVEGSGLLPVRVRFNDDFGLSEARLTYWRRGAEAKRSTEIPVPEAQSEGELYGQVDRSALELLPGEKFKFAVSVWDNDTVRGPKKSRLGPVEISVLSWSEMMARRDRMRGRSSRMMREMSSTTEKLRKELENMMRRGGDKDWEKARRMQRLQNRLRQQQKKLRQTRKKMNEYRESSPGLSAEHLKKLREVRELMNKHAQGALKQSRKALNKAVKKQLQEQKLNKKQLQYSQDSLQKFQQDIERMHSYMEKLDAALKLDEMGQTLEKMVAQQKQLSQGTEMTEQDKRQLQQQAKKWDWMEKRLDKLQEKVSGESKKKLEKLLKKIRRRQPGKQARALSKQSEKSGEQLKKYREFTEKLRGDMQEVLSSQKQQRARKKQSLRSQLMNYWTAWFGALQDWAGTLDQLRFPPRFRAQHNSQLTELNAAIQEGVILTSGWSYLAQLTRRIGRMDMNFPREILQKLDPQARRLQTVNDRLKSRRPRGLNKKLSALQKSQAKLIAAFLDWERKQKQQSGKGGKGGGQPTLSQLLQQQKKLMQSMQPAFQKQSVTPGLAQKFARQQRMIQQGLKNLMQNREDQQKVLGDLKKLTDQMDKATKRMQEEKFDRKLKSQEKTILQRLEQATKALSRGSEKQRIKRKQDRQAKTATGADTRSFEPSTYQQIMEKIQPDISELSPADREAVLRFYRYWYKRDGEAEPVR